MLILALLRWWYIEGFQGQIRTTRRSIGATADYFSIALLLKTLFSPFRQISAARTTGPLGVRLRAFGDKLVSRFVGAMLRSLTIAAGVIAIGASCLLGCIKIIGWALVPVTPFIGLLFTLFKVGL